MKYENYKIENLIFLKKETEKWGETEKREFLESCPENESLPTIIEQLKVLKQALEDEAVKANQYGTINKNSLKAYVKKHDLKFCYGQPNHYYYSSSCCFYFNVDGHYEPVGYVWQIQGYIDKYNGGGNIEKRFEYLSNYYLEKETRFAKKIETDSYKATHAEQIFANNKLDRVLDDLRITVPIAVETDEYNHIDVKSDCMPYSSCYHNEYGEILVNKTPLTEKQATDLMNTIFEMSARISEIMGEYKETINSTLGRR